MWKRLLKAPDPSDAIGQRDRAMLEVLYACGLRVTELISLTLEQVNLRQGVLRVMGKGSKERLVPMGEEAIVWVERYMRDGRGEVARWPVPAMCCSPASAAKQMTRQTFWHRIKHQGQGRRDQQVACRRIPCATHLPRTCSTMARTCAWCRCCSGTATSLRRRSIPMSPAPDCRICTPNTTHAADTSHNVEILTCGEGIYPRSAAQQSQTLLARF